MDSFVSCRNLAGFFHFSEILLDSNVVSLILLEFGHIFSYSLGLFRIPPDLLVFFLILPVFHVFSRILSDFSGFSHILPDFSKLSQILCISFGSFPILFCFVGIRLDSLIFFRNLCLFFGFCWIFWDYLALCNIFFGFFGILSNSLNIWPNSLTFSRSFFHSSGLSSILLEFSRILLHSLGFFSNFSGVSAIPSEFAQILSYTLGLSLILPDSLGIWLDPLIFSQAVVRPPFQVLFLYQSVCVGFS